MHILFIVKNVEDDPRDIWATGPGFFGGPKFWKCHTLNNKKNLNGLIWVFLCLAKNFYI